MVKLLEVLELHFKISSLFLFDLTKDNRIEIYKNVICFLMNPSRNYAELRMKTLKY